MRDLTAKEILHVAGGTTTSPASSFGYGVGNGFQAVVNGVARAVGGGTRVVDEFVSGVKRSLRD